LTSSPGTSTAYGRIITVNGRLTYKSSGQGVAYAGLVHLQRRPAGTSQPWKNVAAASPDNYGRFHTHVTARASSQYRWRYVGQWFGSGSSTSSPITITVHQGVVTSLSPSTIPPGGWSILTTTLKPGSAGELVHLQRKTASGWADVDAKAVTAKG